MLGATGSIGRNTLSLIAENAADYRVVALTANRKWQELARLARAHGAEFAAIADERYYGELREALAGSEIEVGAGQAALIEAAKRPCAWLMAAIIGSAGLAPTLAAVSRGCTVALANKECLVTAGALFMAAVAQHGTTLLPVDSEHSAAFQAMDGSPVETIERLVLTASGGPFREWSREALRKATPQQALRHPNWDMGAKITIDSATLMNKGFELIEAHHLFALPPAKLDVLIHPQSIVHCLVAYHDGSVLAQLAMPDMRAPIAYSLAWPRRMATSVPRLDLAALARLEFAEPDTERFPALALARQALEAGEAACNVLNAANEVAVEAFLAGRIGFTAIPALVEETLAQFERLEEAGAGGDLEAVLALDRAGRALARSLLEEYDDVLRPGLAAG